MKVTPGSTDVTTYFALVTTVGADATALTITDLDLQYVRSGANPVAKVDATALAATNTAHTDNKAIEVDATDQPGLYRVDWPDAAFDVGVREVILTINHASCRAAHLRVSLESTSTGDAYARLGAPAGASVSADIAAVKVDTAAIKAKTDNLPSDPADASDIASSFTTVNTKLDALPTAAANADAVWDEARAGHVSAGSFGEGVVVVTYTGNTPQTGDSFPRIGAPVGASISADIAAVKTDSGNLISRLGAFTGTGVNTVLGFFKGLLSKSASTPSDVGGTFDATTDSTEAIRDRGDAAWLTATGFSTLDAAGVRSALGLAIANLDTQLDALPTAGENADAVWDEARAGHVGAGSFGQGVVVNSIAADAVDAAALKADAVTEIQSGLATQASVDDLPTNAELATALAAADDAVLAALAGGVDANLVAINGAAEPVNRMERALDTEVLVTVDAGSTTTSIVASSVSGSATADQFVGLIMKFPRDTTTGNLRGQGTRITGYDHATLTFTVVALTDAPVSGDTAIVV